MANSMANRGKTAEEIADKCIGVYKILNEGAPGASKESLLHLAVSFMNEDDAFWGKDPGILKGIQR